MTFGNNENGLKRGFVKHPLNCFFLIADPWFLWVDWLWQVDETLLLHGEATRFSSLSDITY